MAVLQAARHRHLCGDVSFFKFLEERLWVEREAKPGFDLVSMLVHGEATRGMSTAEHLGNLFLLILNLPLVGLFVRILALPRWFLMPAVAALSFVAVYAVNRSAFDLVLMTAFGGAGYLLRKLDFPLAPIILGLVLGPLMEKNLRRALSLSGGDWQVLFSSPLAIERAISISGV